MKMRAKKVAASLMSVMILMSTCFVVHRDVQAAEPTGTASEVTIGVADGVTVSGYMFTPDNSANLGQRATTCPIIVVFGDEVYTQETAVSTAIFSGLASIAKEEGSLILFVNWNGIGDENALNLYNKIIKLYSDSTSYAYVNGMFEGDEFDFMSGSMKHVKYYCGSSQRIYLYGEGSGADFVTRNYMKEIIAPNMYFIPTNYTPTSVTLFNPTIAPTAVASNSEIPMAVVNPVNGTQSVIASLNQTHKAFKLVESGTISGFDKSQLLSLYDELSGKYRRQVGVIHEIPNYSALGIHENHNTVSLSNGVMEYYQYIPKNLDLSVKGSIPLMMIFHGGGNHAEYQAWASEWPLIGKEKGFMVVSVNQHTSKNATDIIELLDYLLAQYPAIDATRVYASGYSMGSIKSWDLCEQYTNRFAGIAPMHGSMAASSSIPNQIMPVFFVGGEESPLPEFPHQTGAANNIDSRLDFIFKMNKVTNSYVYNISVNKWWGITPNATQLINNPTYAGSVLTLNKFISADGNIYTILCNTSKEGHEVYAANSRAAWDFLSQFSRNADGSIKINSTVVTTPQVPKTGDDFNPLMIYTLLGSFSAIIVIGTKRYKKCLLTNY